MSFDSDEDFIANEAYRRGMKAAEAEISRLTAENLLLRDGAMIADYVGQIDSLRSALSIALEGLEKIAEGDTFLAGGVRSCASATIAKVEAMK